MTSHAWRVERRTARATAAMIKELSFVSMGAGWRPWFAPSCQSAAMSAAALSLFSRDGEEPNLDEPAARPFWTLPDTAGQFGMALVPAWTLRFVLEQMRPNKGILCYGFPMTRHHRQCGFRESPKRAVEVACKLRIRYIFVLFLGSPPGKEKMARGVGAIS